MSKLTKAQAALLKRAQSNDFVKGDGFMGRNNSDGYNRLCELSRKYGEPFFGATRLHGSADFRVARAVQEAGLGSLASCPITDGYWLIAEISKEEAA